MSQGTPPRKILVALSREVGSEGWVANRELMCCLSERREAAPTWPMENLERGKCGVWDTGTWPS